MDISFERAPAPVKLSIMVREPQPVRKLAYASAVAKFQHNGGNKGGSGRKI